MIQRRKRKKRKDAGRNKYKPKISGNIGRKEAARGKQCNEGMNGRKRKE
jgi:hypothetical protein